MRNDEAEGERDRSAGKQLPEGETLVTVRNCLYVGDADVIRMELEDAGIDTWLADINMVQAEWLLGNAMGGIKVRVRSGDEAKALQVIAEFDRMRQERRERREEMGRDGEEEDVCLACGTAIEITETTCAECGWSYADSEVELDEGKDEDSVW